MNRPLFLLLTLSMGCATANVPHLAMTGPSTDWEQVPKVASGEPNDTALLFTLRHRPSGSTVRVEAWYQGAKPVRNIADDVATKLQQAHLLALERTYDGRVASFKMMSYDQGVIWGGKVAVLRLNEGPEAPTFILYGRWPDAQDAELARDFDAIVRSAVLD